MSSSTKDRCFLDSRESAAVLAGLRLLQLNEKARWANVAAITSDGGVIAPLSSDEIDALCERLNCGG